MAGAFRALRAERRRFCHTRPRPAGCDYSRTQLAGLLPVDIAAVAMGADGTRALLQRIAKGLREERAKAGGRYYDLARHHALVRALKAETARLRTEIAQNKKGRPDGGPLRTV